MRWISEDGLPALCKTNVVINYDERMKIIYENYESVLKGFNPDPSIVRVDDTYYIANSTFEWFPVFKSRIKRFGSLATDHTSASDYWTVGHERKRWFRWYLGTGFILCGRPGWYTPMKALWMVPSKIASTIWQLLKTSVVPECPIKLERCRFDASLFHDDDGRKYLVQMEWDHREYHHPFNGIKCTEYSVSESDYCRRLPRLFWEGRTSSWLKDRTCTSYSGNIICSAPKAARPIRIKKLLRDQPLYSVNMKDSLKRSWRHLRTRTIRCKNVDMARSWIRRTENGICAFDGKTLASRKWIQPWSPRLVHFRKRDCDSEGVNGRRPMASDCQGRQEA